MKAAVARLEAQKQAVILNKKKEAADRKDKALRIKNERGLQKRREEKFRLECLERVTSAVKSGRRSVSLTIASDGCDKIAQTGYDEFHVQPPGGWEKWHNANGNRNGRGLLYWEENYMKYSPCAKILKKIRKELELDGYKTEVVSNQTCHDESAAYMNSGGECGSETPYYTFDTFLKISW